MGSRDVPSSFGQFFFHVFFNGKSIWKDLGQSFVGFALQPLVLFKHLRTMPVFDPLPIHSMFKSSSEERFINR